MKQVETTDFNEIGIPAQLDWPRIKKLLTIGLFAAVLHLIGDMILGWGREDEALEGIARMLSAYTGTSDIGIFAAGLLGMFGVTLEGLSCFGIYRLMAEKSPKYAHIYRSGILGYVIFGGCGFHVPTCALAFLAKHFPGEEAVWHYAAYFLLPAFALFWVFFLILVITQFKAFRRGLTPYPKWCRVFSMPVGMAAAMLLQVAGNYPITNAISCAWISIGAIWMFGGLLATMKKAETGKRG